MTDTGIRTATVGKGTAQKTFTFRLTFEECEQYDALVAGLGRDLINLLNDLFVTGKQPTRGEMGLLFFVAARSQHGIDSPEAARRYLFEKPRYAHTIINALIRAATDSFPMVEIEDAADGEGDAEDPTRANGTYAAPMENVTAA